jgi:hypothetical protein
MSNLIKKNYNTDNGWSGQRQINNNNISANLNEHKYCVFILYFVVGMATTIDLIVKDNASRCWKCLYKIQVCTFLFRE